MTTSKNVSDFFNHHATNNHPLPSTSAPPISALWISSCKPTTPRKLHGIEKELNKKTRLRNRVEWEKDDLDVNFSLAELPTTNLLNQPDEQAHLILMNFRKRNDEQCLSRPSHHHLPQYNKSVEAGSTLFYADPCYAYYRVTKTSEVDCTLTSLYINLCGRKMMKYKEIHLDEHSKEVNHNCHFVGKLMPGDIIKVFELRKKEDGSLRVHDFSLHPRTIVKGAEVFLGTDSEGERKIVALGYQGMCIEGNGDGKKPPNFQDGIYTCDLFIPAHQTFFKVSKDFEPTSDCLSLDYDIAMKTDPRWKFNNVVLNWRKDDKELDGSESCCKNAVTKEAMELMLLKLRVSCSFAQNIHRSSRKKQESRMVFCVQLSPVEFLLFMWYDYKKTLACVGQKVRVSNHLGDSMILEIVHHININNDEFKCTGRRVDGKEGNFDVTQRVHVKMVLDEEADCISILEASKKQLLDPTCVSILSQLHGSSEQMKRQYDPSLKINFEKFGVTLSLDQAQFIYSFIHEHSISVLDGPSGSGKSLAVLVGLSVWFEYHLALNPNNMDSLRPVLVIAKTEEEVKKLVDAAGSMKKHLPVKILRLIVQQANCETSLKLRTNYDLQVTNEDSVKKYLRKAKPKILFTTMDTSITMIPELLEDVQRIIIENAHLVTITKVEVLSRVLPQSSILLTGNSIEAARSDRGLSGATRMASQSSLAVALNNKFIKKNVLCSAHHRPSTTSFSSQSNNSIEKSKEETMRMEQSRRDEDNDRNLEARISYPDWRDDGPSNSYSRDDRQGMGRGDRQPDEYYNRGHRDDRDEWHYSRISDSGKNDYNDQRGSSSRNDTGLESDHRTNDGYRNDRDCYQKNCDEESRIGCPGRFNDRHDYGRNDRGRDIRYNDRPNHANSRYDNQSGSNGRRGGNGRDDDYHGERWGGHHNGEQNRRAYNSRSNLDDWADTATRKENYDDSTRRK